MTVVAFVVAPNRIALAADGLVVTAQGEVYRRDLPKVLPAFGRFAVACAGRTHLRDVESGRDRWNDEIVRDVEGRLDGSAMPTDPLSVANLLAMDFAQGLLADVWLDIESGTSPTDAVDGQRVGIYIAGWDQAQGHGSVVKMEVDLNADEGEPVANAVCEQLAVSASPIGAVRERPLEEHELPKLYQKIYCEDDRAASEAILLTKRIAEHYSVVPPHDVGGIARSVEVTQARAEEVLVEDLGSP